MADTAPQTQYVGTTKTLEERRKFYRIRTMHLKAKAKKAAAKAAGRGDTSSMT
jgi:hypothetical protein